MYSKKQVFVITVLAIVYCFGESSGQHPEAKLAGARLPTTLKSGAAVNDGMDNVYIFGG
jgi:hypothetical protein